MVFLGLVFYGHEPRYHGRPLKYWVIKLKQGSRKEQAEAREALQAMGKAAVPYLVHTVEKTDSPLKLKILTTYGGRFPYLYWVLRRTSDQERAYAASALGEIGPSASNAIPALVQLNKTNVYRHAAPTAACLMKIRGEPMDGH